MEVFTTTSRKRETYQVHVTYSLLWECALGIAAITNTKLIHTLEKSNDHWDQKRKFMSEELLKHLAYVEKHNTWKALLQLLYQKDFKDLSSFISFIEGLSAEDFRFMCIPYIGIHCQEKRKQAAHGNQDAIDELKKLTSANSFFPAYIEFVCAVNTMELKSHLVQVMSEWYRSIIEPEAEELYSILKRDNDTKTTLKGKMTPEELVEWATGGVTYLPEPSVHHVLLIPQYTYRPWNIEADIEGTKVFHYPVSNESITPDDKYSPSDFLVQKHKALGDEVRLRIVKLLSEDDSTLQSVTDQLNLGKSTVHHHLKILRAAKLVEIKNSKYSLKVKSLSSMPIELDEYLNMRRE